MNLHEISASTSKRNISFLSCAFAYPYLACFISTVHSARVSCLFSCACFPCVEIPTLCLFMYLCLSHNCEPGFKLALSYSGRGDWNELVPVPSSRIKQ